MQCLYIIPVNRISQGVKTGVGITDIVNINTGIELGGCTMSVG